MAASSILVYIHDRRQYVGPYTENVGLYIWPLAVCWFIYKLWSTYMAASSMLVYIHDRQQYVSLYTHYVWSTYMTASSMLVYIDDRRQYVGLYTHYVWSTYLTASSMLVYIPDRRHNARNDYHSIYICSSAELTGLNACRPIL
jgi:hypothetical protein